MSLWLCLRFEQLPLQCLSHSEQHPVVVLALQRVLRANDCAAALGIRQGMGSATVRALAGEEAVQLLERDEQAEQRSLQQLCCWAYNITPTLHTWRSDCLQLEVGGSLTLFRGLEPLLAAITGGITRRGYDAHLGLAATPKAAWLLSFATEDVALAHHLPLEQRLAPLPLALLDDFRRNVDSLRRAGLHTLGDILTLAPAVLGRRCGKAFTLFLQQLLGQQQDLQPDYQPPAVFNDEFWFGYEVKTNSELLPTAQQLLQSLCHFLRNTQLQTGEIIWKMTDVEGHIQEMCVRSSNTHSDWKSWYQLSDLRFAQLQLRTGVEGLALSCQQLRARQAESIDLFSPHNQREPLASLLDRLHNRLGLQAIKHVSCRDEHLPEQAVLASSHHTDNANGYHPHCHQRPFWLMPQPQALRQQRGQLYWHSALELLSGPERIEDNWWQEAVSRDYFIAQGNGGEHYWIFHDRLSCQWYIHGVFA